MKKTTRKFSGLILLWITAVWVFMDANTLNLCYADPATGRERGCYTGLELSLGLQSPSGWIPLVELLFGMVLLVASLCISLIYAKRLIVKQLHDLSSRRSQRVSALRADTRG